MQLNTYDLDDALGFWMHLAFNRMRNRTVQHLRGAPYVATPEQWAVLVRLWQQDGRTQTELARATFRDKTSVTRMVDSLEKNGLVRRQPSLADRRKHAVVLTDAGRDAEHKLTPIMREWVAHVFRDIPADDLQTAQRVMRRVYENLQ